MTIIAAAAVLLALGGHLAIRYADRHNRLDDDLATFLLSIPSDEWLKK